MSDNSKDGRRPLDLLVLAIVGGILALGLIAASAWRTFRELEDASTQRQAAYEFLMSLRLLRQHVGEARVGVTGYALTGDTAYRGTYLRAVTGFQGDTTALRRLAGGAPTLHATLDTLGHRLGAYETALARIATKAGTGPAPGLGVELRDLRRFLLTENVRPPLLALDEEQKRLMAAGAASVAGSVGRSRLLIALATILGAIVVIGAGAALAVQLLARERSESALRESERRLVTAQKMEAVARLAGGVAHDFNNLLTVIIGETELALAALETDDSVADGLRNSRDAARRAAQLTQQLLAFSRQQLVEPEVFDMNQAVSNLGVLVRRLIGEDIEVVSYLAPDAGSVKADPGQFEQVVMNLVVNARDAMPEGGRLTLQTANVELDDGYAKATPDVQPGEYVMLAVSDTGSGMTEEVKSHVFEPFFTTKEMGKGTGLGLATSFGIVKQARGHLAVYSEPGVGTTFRVYLPRVYEAVEQQTRPDVGALPRGSETILLVEDEAAVRAIGVRILQSQGYTVMEAPNGAEALRQLDIHEGPVHLLLTDAVLPGMGGRELAERVQTTRPDIAVLFASGYTEDAAMHQRLLDRQAAFLHKPFTRESMARKVREVLDRA